MFTSMSNNINQMYMCRIKEYHSSTADLFRDDPG